MRWLKRIGLGLLGLVVAAMVAIVVWVYPSEDLRDLPSDLALPRFERVEVPFSHVWDREHGFHLSGGAVLDVDGDGGWEVFVGGGHGQDDVLLAWVDGALEDCIEGTGLSSSASATYGSTAIDIDDDGDTDLFVARDDGITLYENDGAGNFTPTPFEVDLPDDSVALNVAISDIDHDGDGDAHVSVFIESSMLRSATYNDPSHAKPNVMLRNDGGGTWTDVTTEATAGRQNTFTSIFTDLDGDGWQDLVMSQNTGPVEFARNVKGTFEAFEVDTGYGFWMGVAAGDPDADGDVDLVFTNAGNSVPAALTRGDLRDDQRLNLEWIALRNEGDMQFTDVTEESGLTGLGFAWGAAFSDVNLDGQLDLAVAQSYVKWPVHSLLPLPGKVMLNTPASGGRPEWFPWRGADNPYFGHSPLFVDFDGDGRLDLLWINSNSPSQAFLNRTNGSFVTVALPDTVGSLGAKVTLEGGRVAPTWEVITSGGLGTDAAPVFTFGLRDAEDPERLVVEWPDGRRSVVESPETGRRIDVAPPPPPAIEPVDGGEAAGETEESPVAD